MQQLGVMKSITFVIAAAMLALAPGARAQDKPCMADAARLCAGIEPGAAQIACLKEHKQELSPACKKHVMQTKVKKMEREEMQKEQEELKKQQEKTPAPPAMPPP